MIFLWTAFIICLFFDLVVFSGTVNAFKEDKDGIAIGGMFLSAAFILLTAFTADKLFR